MDQDGTDPVQPALPPGQQLSDDERVAVAAAEVAWLEVLHEGLINGSRSWAEWDGSLGSMPDPTAIAISRCGAALARAQEELRALRHSDDEQS